MCGSLACSDNNGFYKFLSLELSKKKGGGLVPPVVSVAVEELVESFQIFLFSFKGAGTDGLGELAKGSWLV